MMMLLRLASRPRVRVNLLDGALASAVRISVTLREHGQQWHAVGLFASDMSAMAR
jgi:hypothetical protein